MTFEMYDYDVFMHDLGLKQSFLTRNWILLMLKVLELRM